jgi:hypothetical protein
MEVFSYFKIKFNFSISFDELIVFIDKRRSYLSNE